nr:hypothetical protein [Mucilaginibacter sp. L294]
MADNSTLLQVSAFSGLIGALLTQCLTGLFSYIGDKRKSNTELKNTYRNKQVDIAENFYFVTGEKMAIVKKNIDYWNNYNNARSDKSLDFLNQEIVKLNAYMDKLDTENWKYNLVSLYFDVTLTNDQVIASNLKSKEQYLKVLDLREGIRHALDVEKNDLYDLYDDAIKEMCKHYEIVYLKMTEDMAVVKTSLTGQFSK